MQWQDSVLATGQFVVASALIPSIFSKDRPALATSLMFGTVLSVFAFTLATLKLWLSVIPMTITAILWFILAYQKYQMREK